MNQAISLATGIGLVVLMCCVGASAKTDVRDWRQFSVPTLGGYDKVTPRPTDAEFLKLLPRLRKPPKFDAVTQKRGMALWWGDCSVPFFSEQPPTQAELIRQPVIKAVPGEDEPLVFGLWGIRHAEQVTLNVKHCPFPVTVRLVEFRPRKVPGDNYGDSVKGGRIVGFSSYLPKGNIGEVKQGQNTVFWLTVHVPSSAKPGRYNASVTLTAGDVAKIVEAPFVIEVLNYSLPPANVAFGMYFRPIADEFLPAKYRTPEMLRAYWRDMASHGMTSATIYNVGGPLYHENGAAKFDGQADVATINDMMNDGLLRQSIPIIWLGGIPASAAPAVVGETKKRGFPEFLLYGPDEPVPGDKGAEKHFKSIQPMRKHFRIVTAIADNGATAYADSFDVWAVSGGRITPALMKLAHEKGAELWTYDCVNQAMGNAASHRFYAGLYMWAFNIKGNFLWCYAEGYTWEGNKNGRFCYVLPSLDGPVPSVQWEARREGTKDYRTMRFLERLIAAKPSSKKAIEAKSWLDSTRARVDWYIARKMPPCLDPIDGVGLYPLCPNFAPEELSGVRDKATKYILELRKIKGR